ncbi:MAG: hypothetical protein PHH13_02490 [Candidatus Peribacteraceae bacterium]|nr:hypothetical protein [Candidatus Peribacteraceae bacterium]
MTKRLVLVLGLAIILVSAGVIWKGSSLSGSVTTACKRNRDCGSKASCVRTTGKKIGICIASQCGNNVKERGEKCETVNGAIVGCKENKICTDCARCDKQRKQTTNSSSISTSTFQQDDDQTRKCAAMGGAKSSQCFRDLAIDRTDAELCTRAGNLANICYNAIAVQTRNPLLCDRITDSSDTTQQRCRKFASQIPFPSTEEECIAKNGVWAIHGLSPMKSCNLPTSDKGKICTNVDECEGTCLGNVPTATSGTCSEWRLTFGCRIFLMQGNARQLCVD